MYDRSIGEEVCRRISEGESLRSICSCEGMPNRQTIFRWLRASEDFQRSYAAAHEVYAAVIAGEIIEISDDARNDWMDRQRPDGSTERVLDHEHVQRSKLRIEARKWLAGVLEPRKYGPATLLKHADAEGGSLAVLSAVQAARARIAALESGNEPHEEG